MQNRDKSPGKRPPISYILLRQKIEVYYLKGKRIEPRKQLVVSY